MLDGAGGGSAAAPEPAVTVLDGRAPGVRLLRPTDALDDTAGRVLQRVAADVLACAPPFVLVDLSAVDTVTADGVAALVVVAETAGEADIGLAVVAGTGCAPRSPRTTSTICSSCTRPWMRRWRPCDGVGRRSLPHRQPSLVDSPPRTGTAPLQLCGEGPYSGAAAGEFAVRLGGRATEAPAVRRDEPSGVAPCVTRHWRPSKGRAGDATRRSCVPGGGPHHRTSNCQYLWMKIL